MNFSGYGQFDTSVAPSLLSSWLNLVNIPGTAWAWIGSSQAAPENTDHTGVGEWIPKRRRVRLGAVPQKNCRCLITKLTGWIPLSQILMLLELTIHCRASWTTGHSSPGQGVPGYPTPTMPRHLPPGFRLDVHLAVTAGILVCTLLDVPFK
jgi:hypothetical protein